MARQGRKCQAFTCGTRCVLICQRHSLAAVGCCLLRLSSWLHGCLPGRRLLGRPASSMLPWRHNLCRATRLWAWLGGRRRRRGRPVCILRSRGRCLRRCRHSSTRPILWSRCLRPALRFRSLPRQQRSVMRQILIALLAPSGPPPYPLQSRPGLLSCGDALVSTAGLAVLGPCPISSASQRDA